MYTEQGQKLSDVLWKETMEDLKFADVEGIVERFAKSQVTSL